MSGGGRGVHLNAFFSLTVGNRSPKDSVVDASGADEL